MRDDRVQRLPFGNIHVRCGRKTVLSEIVFVEDADGMTTDSLRRFKCHEGVFKHGGVLGFDP